jgi:hypothetical protein
MKINLNFQFKNLQGKEYDKFLKDEKGNFTGEIADNNNAAKSLGLTLYHSSEKNIKFNLWAQELYKSGSLEIDETDLDILIAWIENYVIAEGRQITNPWFAQNGIRMQIVESLKNQKEKLKDKKK